MNTNPAVRLTTTTALKSALAVTLMLATGTSALASSHREAPAITGSPRVDGTDLYMFRSYETGRAAFTTILSNYIPGQDAYNGPNYAAMDPNAIYEIHIDNTGDAVEDITYQFKFSESLNGGNGIAIPVGGQNVAIPLKNAGTIAAGNSANLNYNQTYTVTQITGPRRTGTRTTITNASGGGSTFIKPMDYIGTKTFGNSAAYQAYADQYKYNITIPGCGTPGRMFVGQRKEGFQISLGPIFDLINASQSDVTGGGVQDPDLNDLDDKNITTIALEVPNACLTGSGNGVIGAWMTASVPQAKLTNPRSTFARPEVTGGAFTQVSRLGMPLVNELVIGLKDKDLFSGSQPRNDTQFATYVTNPTLPALIELLFPAAPAPTNFPRQDLVTTFLTGFPGVNQLATVTPSDMLRLNTGVAPTAAGSQSNFGFVGNDAAGFPNGRRPGDDIVDLSLRVAMGRLCHPVTNAAVGLNNANLGLCSPGQAAAGLVAFTDNVPTSAADFDTSFPYLKTPLPGAI